MPKSTDEIVLVLEPAKGIKKQLKKALSGADVVFSSGARFLVEATRKHPGVILMDAQLPGQDGFKICQQLAVHPATRDIPILYVTASVDQLEEFGPDADRVIATDDFGSLAQRVKALASEGRVQQMVRETLATAEALDKARGLTKHEVDVLESGGFSVDAKLNPEPITKGAAAYDRLIANSLTVALAAKKLRVSGGRVRQRLLANPPELYGIRKGKTWRLPAFQFGPRELVPNIERVIVKLDPASAPQRKTSASIGSPMLVFLLLCGKAWAG